MSEKILDTQAVRGENSDYNLGPWAIDEDAGETLAQSGGLTDQDLIFSETGDFTQSSTFDPWQTSGRIQYPASGVATWRFKQRTRIIPDSMTSGGTFAGTVIIAIKQNVIAKDDAITRVVCGLKGTDDKGPFLQMTGSSGSVLMDFRSGFTTGTDGNKTMTVTEGVTETLCFVADYSRGQIYRFRDGIIESFAGSGYTGTYTLTAGNDHGFTVGGKGWGDTSIDTLEGIAIGGLNMVVTPRALLDPIGAGVFMSNNISIPVPDCYLEMV